MSFNVLRFAAFPVLFAVSSIAPAQTLKNLTHQAPGGSGLSFQMTDGTVLSQGGGLSDWYKLTPDENGSYLNGTWTQVASLPSGYSPDAFTSAVMADGRLVVVGGEYNEGGLVFTNKCAVYDPQANTWTPLAAPPGWGFIGDSPAVVLPSGHFLVGRKLDTRMASLDPVTLTWTELHPSGKVDFNAEEGWTLLPGGTVLTYDVKNAPHSEKYIPNKALWISAGSTISNLRIKSNVGPIPYGNGRVYNPPGEVGPGILRPDGTVFATGASYTGHGLTAIYTPGPNPTDPGTWLAGPAFTNDDAGDTSAALLPSGNVLVSGNSGRFWEFDGTNLKPTVSGGGFLMILPTGEALVTGGFNAQLYIPTGTYNPSWAPNITSVPNSLVRGNSYKISGTQFNGLSQAAAFGDEYQTATNYPLVRITNTASGHVFYARTHDHSTMGVATGSAIVFTHFDVPPTMETGPSTIVVVANGIPSTPVTVQVN